MNNAKNTFPTLIIALTIMLTTLAVPFYSASAGNSTGDRISPTTISEEESASLMKLYQLSEELEVKNITVKIYSANDELIYSVEGCKNEIDCDERINQMINSSDFITEIDNTRIYYLAH